MTGGLTGRVGRAVLVVALLAMQPVGAAAATDGLDPLAPPPPPAVDTPVARWPVPPAVTADAFMLLDGRTGQILAARDAAVRRPVASTVKVLTALTFLRRTEPGDVVTVGSEVMSVGGAGVGLEPGEQWTADELLDGLIARSGNDAAVAVAVHVGGTVDAFVKLMEDDAAALGIGGLDLSSPSGLQDANRLSATDLAIFTRTALGWLEFREAAAATTVVLPDVGEVVSRNEFLAEYPGATGVKTGFTDLAGYCFIASAERDGRQLVAVVLGSDTAESRFTDAAALLDHGFERFSRRAANGDLELAVGGGHVTLTTATVKPLLPPGDLSVTPELTVDPPVPGTAEPAAITFQGQLIGTVPVTVTTAQGAPLTGGAALGREVMDRIYSAMRAATIAGAWSG